MGYAKGPNKRDKNMLNKTGYNISSSGEGPLASFVRPQSANQRKVDLTAASTEINPGLRQLLQQNVQQNRENSKQLF